MILKMKTMMMDRSLWSPKHGIEASLCVVVAVVPAANDDDDDDDNYDDYDVMKGHYVI